MNKHFLDQCEQEKLHLSGEIQPHGTLIVANSEHCITHLAANFAQFLPDAIHLELNQELPDFFLAYAQSADNLSGKKRIYSAVIEGKNEAKLDLVISRNSLQQTVMELIPHVSGPYLLSPLNPKTQIFIDLGDPILDPNELVNEVIKLIQFDRVLYYQFQEDGDGIVIAEVATQKLVGSYMGLRFPASDVPKIARSLYVNNPWRMICNALANSVSIYSLDSSMPDLSLADLRSVSPIHAVYLSNMGVQASISFPIFFGNELWGLIACHDSQPQLTSLALLDKISTKIRAHTKLLAENQSKYRIQLIDGLARRFHKIEQLLTSPDKILAEWSELGGWLANEFEADGAVIIVNNQLAQWGIGFESDVLDFVDTWFAEKNESITWCGDFLRYQIPEFPLSQIAGMLAIKIKLSDGSWLRIYLCRQEHIYEVAWGGNPNKPIEYAANMNISPRRSFEKWIEKRIGQSRPWGNESRLLSLKFRELIMQRFLSST